MSEHTYKSHELEETMKIEKLSIAALAGALAILFLAWVPAHVAAESENERQLVKLVDQAVQLVNTEGSAAFPRFHKKGTMWREGETYIFIGDTAGVILVNGGNRSLEGQNLLDTKDVNGKLFIQAFIETVTTKGSGWVDYLWPKPGQTTPVKKMSYVKEAKLGDKTLFVGAGFYMQ